MNEIKYYNVPKTSERQSLSPTASCPSTSRTEEGLRLYCTLDEGHGLPHEAGIHGNEIVAEWS